MTVTKATSGVEAPDMSEAFIVPIETGVPVSAAVPMLEVTAPSDLPGGYQLPVTTGDNRQVTVTVPEGGVSQGQTFRVPYSTQKSGSSAPPVGNFKDGLFDCFTYGICHKVLCCAIFFPTILNAQVMTRLKLNWIANPAKNATQVQQTFGIVAFIVLSYVIIDSVLSSLEEKYGNTTAGSIRDVLGVIYFFYYVYIIMMTRRFLRQKYSITANQCCGGSCDDFWLAFCCTCCTVAQMTRHTADYHVVKGDCCSRDGLKDMEREEETDSVVGNSPVIV